MHDDGYTIRPMRSSDAAELIEFTTRVFGLEIGEPDTTAGIWAADMVRGDHPTTRPEHGRVAVDDATGRIVACSFLISQTWTFDGLPIRVGRPELIASDPSVRGRGIVRTVLDAIHAQGDALGHRLHALTGIPYYYRRYGYEPGIVTAEDYHGPADRVPLLLPDGTEPVTIRPVTEADLPTFVRFYARAAARPFITALLDEPIWRYELTARSPLSDYWHELRLIEDDSGVIGAFAFQRALNRGTIGCTICELADDADWPRLTPTILRYLKAAGEHASKRDNESFDGIWFDWTPNHPFAFAAADVLTERGNPFAWYVRVPDYAVLLRELTPLLDRRLAESEFATTSDEFTISWYPNGLRLRIEDGRVVTIEPIPFITHRQADLCLPPTGWQQLIFGSRTLTELEIAFPFETRLRSDRARKLTETLFPRRPSAIWPVA